MKTTLLVLFSLFSISLFATTSGSNLIRSGATKSDIRSQSGITGAIFTIIGRDTITDGRGGSYYWDSLSTSSDDSSTIYKAPSTIGRWIVTKIPARTGLAAGIYNTINVYNSNGIDSVTFSNVVDNTLLHKSDTISLLATQNSLKSYVKYTDSTTFATKAWVQNQGYLTSSATFVKYSDTSTLVSTKSFVQNSITKYYNHSGVIVGQTKIFNDTISPTTALGFSISTSAAGFTSIQSIQVQVESNQTSASTAPLVSIKSYTNSTVVVNLVQANSALISLGILPLSVLGLQPLQSLTGVRVHITVFGN